MHPTFAVCNNGAHVVRLRLSLSWVTSTCARVCARNAAPPTVAYLSGSRTMTRLFDILSLSRC